MAWPCFWVEETDLAEVSLRRYAARGEGETTACPGPYGYHNASVVLHRAAARFGPDHSIAAIPVEEYADDPRWPVECPHCGYVFTDDDSRQVNQDIVYRRPDTGEEWAGHTLPTGAMFDAPWYHAFGVGPDEIALVVVLPPMTEGDTRGLWWHVDGPARSEGHTKPGAWTRTGDPKAVPPTVDVNPSILTPSYHGYLRNGVLTDPV